VDCSLSDTSQTDLYHLFRTDFLPGMVTDDCIDPPTLPRDIPVWLRICDFHGYLDDHLLNKEKRLKLVEAATHPRMSHPKYGNLHKWVFEYMKALQHISKHKVVYTILKWVRSMDFEYVLAL
jgi:hypothetical protein